MVKIFHHNDLDGYSSGYLTYKYFKELGRDDIIATSMDYNSKFDLFDLNNIKKDDEVYIVDYHISPELFKELQSKCLEAVWIDHHVSAIEEYDKYFKELGLNLDEEVLGSWRNGDSATKLVYEYFYGDNIPKWVNLVDAWDVWKTDSEYYEEAELLNLACQNKLSIDLIKEIDTDKKLVEVLINIGKYFKEYRDQWSESFANKYGFETSIEDLDGTISSIYVLTLGNANSKYFGNKIDEYDYCVTQGFDGEKWNISVYSNKPNKDCSKFARVFGGGGHKGASGFTYEGYEPLFTKSKNRNNIKIEEVN